MSDPPKTITVFPDTNILLHYPPIKDIDWISMCKASSVRIVMCLQVIHELDDKKDHSTLSGRASRAIKEIKHLGKQADVRPNVSLGVFNYQLKNDDFPGTLSSASGDDIVVRLVQKYSEQSPAEQVFVLTEDYGMQLRCETHGISVIEPDRTLRLESPASQLQKKYKQAITELNALKNKLPDISVILAKPKDDAADDQFLIIEGVPSAYTLSDVEAEVSNERRRLAPSPHPTPNMLASMGLLDLRYPGRLEEYLREYEAWLEAKNAAQAPLSLRFNFRIVIKNTGTTPADDLDAVLHFPPILRFLLCDDASIGDFPNIPPEPKPPKENMAGLFKGFDSELAMSRMLSHVPLSRLNDPELRKDEDGSFSIHLPVRRIKHYDHISFDASALFASVDLVKGFEVDVIVTAANLPTKIERKIPVKVVPS